MVVDTNYQKEIAAALAFAPETHFATGFGPARNFGGESVPTLLAKGAGGAMICFF